MPHLLDSSLSSLSDGDLLFITLFGEVRGEPTQGQIGVGAVIRNRALSPQQSFGKGWSGVLSRWAAFSCLWPELGGMNYPTVLGASKHVTEMRTIYHALSTVTEGIYNGTLLDPTNGATHYHEASVKPKWVVGATFCGQIGRHLFWKGVK